MLTLYSNTQFFENVAKDISCFYRYSKKNSTPEVRNVDLGLTLV